MIDSNLRIEQHSRSCTNQNSMLLPQHNGDVLSDRRDSVGGPSTSVEYLFSAWDDGVSTKFKTCNSYKYLLTNSFFQPADKIASFSKHRTYSCPNYEKSYVTCNSSNLIYTIICSNCFMQYIRERAQQLNIKFISQRASMSGKIKSNSCKWLTRHFSTWVLEKLNILYK